MTYREMQKIVTGEDPDLAPVEPLMEKPTEAIFQRMEANGYSREVVTRAYEDEQKEVVERALQRPAGQLTKQEIQALAQGIREALRGDAQ